MIGTLIELLVCALLATTIGYCVVLDRRLRRLRADEETMRRTVIELVVATETAERAVAGLRGVVHECGQTITEHLRSAEKHTADLAMQIRSGDDVIARIARIVETARGRSCVDATPVPAAELPHAERLAATVAAAKAFADRAQRRVSGEAA